MNRINLIPLKNYIKKESPKGSLICEVITEEDDSLTVEEFLAKVPIWLKMKNSER